MSETTDYTDLDLYSNSPSTIGKQNQIITAINTLSVALPIDTFSAVIDVGAGTTTSIVEGVNGVAIWVYGWYVGASVGAGSYAWSADATAKTGTIPIGVNGGGVMASTLPIFKCATGEDLILTTVGSDIDGIVQYILV